LQFNGVHLRSTGSGGDKSLEAGYALAVAAMSEASGAAEGVV
jgi:hypothetical protein